MISLPVEDECVNLIRERVRSRQWWVIVSASPCGSILANAIERKFYSGDNSQFFDAVMVPAQSEAMPALAALFFARKQEMSPEQLSELLRGMIDNAPAVDGSQDLLLTPDTPVSFLQWLTQVAG